MDDSQQHKVGEVIELGGMKVTPLGPAPLSLDDIEMVSYYANHCPITFSECQRAAQLEPGETMLQAYAQLRFEYGLAMFAQLKQLRKENGQ